MMIPHQWTTLRACQCKRGPTTGPGPETRTRSLTQAPPAGAGPSLPVSLAGPGGHCGPGASG
eukprot:223225-Rhodomonas_salina.2